MMNKENDTIQKKAKNDTLMLIKTKTKEIKQKIIIMNIFLKMEIFKTLNMNIIIEITI